MSARTKVAIVGAGFIGEIHLEAYQRFVPDAEVVAVCSRTTAKAEALVRRHGVPASFSDFDHLLSSCACDIVDVCVPNDLHLPVTLAAAAAGKHVICEKPLARTLEEADAMIEACRRAGVKLMYAEELCFAPKYERVPQLVNEGALGRVIQLRQSEKHSGPHSDWFYDVERAGGGVLMDMGCHAFAWFRWMLGGNPSVESVFATMSTQMHGQRTRGEDNVVAIVEFDGGAIGVAEDSWAKPGGMDDRIEVYGTRGVLVRRSVRRQLRVDLQRGGLRLRARKGRLDRAAGRSQSSKRRSTRAIRRNCGISSIACATIARRSSPAKTAAPYSRSFTPPMNRPAPVAR